MSASVGNMQPLLTHRPPVRPGRWGALLVALAFAVLAIAPSAGAAPASLRVQAQPYGSYQSGGVNVLFPSPQASVQLSEVGNASEASTLSVEQILEVDTSATAPQVVAVAFPSAISKADSAAPGGNAPVPVDLAAVLVTYQSSAALWAGPGGLVRPTGPPVGTANLALDYTVGPSAASGASVTLNWTVDGWPWLSGNDLLGIQLALTTPSGSGIVACSGALGGPASTGCSGTPLSPSGTLWANSVVGVQDKTGSGAAARVVWSNVLSASASDREPVTAGVLAQSSSFGHLLLAAPGHGSSGVTGSIGFSLIPPASLPPATYLVHGQSGWFGGAVAAFAALSVLGWVGYRRRSRALEREL